MFVLMFGCPPMVSHRSGQTSVDSLTTPVKSYVVDGCRWGLSTPSAGITMPKATRYCSLGSNEQCLVCSTTGSLHSIALNSRGLKIEAFHSKSMEISREQWNCDCGCELAADRLLNGWKMLNLRWQLRVSRANLNQAVESMLALVAIWTWLLI